MEFELIDVIEEFPEGIKPQILKLTKQILKTFGDTIKKQDFDAFREEFNSFRRQTEQSSDRAWKAIEELAQAQKRTEQRLDFLSNTVGELAQAQKKTEERVEELAQAQKRTEDRLDSLSNTVGELAQAQKKTEGELIILTRRVDKLAETVDELSETVKDLSVTVGGLSDTIGYGLEDKSYTALIDVIRRDFHIKVDKLYRKNIVYGKHKFDEVNIYGEAQKDGKTVYIVGECKARFGVKNLEKYIKMTERVKACLGSDIIPIILAYQYHPDAEEELKNANIKYYWSYEVTS
ncbi:hypothetical protein MCHI_002628 [Candidatus Magnetoovum chiemensis]|nr:hypothetical protein MCHI_002628 [Candidatus Magnetoovum chiemensis]